MVAQVMGTGVPKEHLSLLCPRPCSSLDNSFAAGFCGAHFVPHHVPVPSVPREQGLGLGCDCLVGTERRFPRLGNVGAAPLPFAVLTPVLGLVSSPAALGKARLRSW